MRSIALLPLLLAPLAGCETLAVQRTARVPHAAAPLHDGQPMEGQVAFSAGLDNAVDLQKPAVGNAQASVETPSLQMRDELRARIFERGEIGLIYERAFGPYERLDKTQAPVEQGDPAGYGFAVRYSIPLDPHWSLGTQMELMTWRIPYVEWTACIDNCVGDPYVIQAHKTDSATTFGVGITPSYRSGPLTLFGGIFIRNHPTVERKSIEIGEPDPEPIENGPINAIASLGASYRFGSGVSALAQITQDLVADPVQYYPGIGVALQIELGDKVKPRSPMTYQQSPQMVTPVSPAPLPPPAPEPSGPPGADPVPQ